jgi:chromosome segregation ATPase
MKEFVKERNDDSVQGSLLRHLRDSTNTNAGSNKSGTSNIASLTPKSLKRKADGLFDKLEAAASSKDDVALQQLRAQYAGLMSACRSLRRKIDLQSPNGEKADKKMEVENDRKAVNEQEAEETTRAFEQAKKTTAVLMSSIKDAESERATKHEHAMSENEQKEERVAMLTEKLKKRQEDLSNIRTIISTVRSSIKSPQVESSDSHVEEQAQVAAEETCVEMRQKLKRLQEDSAKVCSTDPQAQQICKELKSVHSEVEQVSKKLKLAETKSQLAKSLTLKLVGNLDTTNPHVLALNMLNTNSGEMALDELKSAVGLKAIYTLVANSLIKIDRLQTPNTAIFLL